jgi:predicted transcriptional regulator
VREIFQLFRGSQMALAKEMGLTRSAVSNWLHGRPSRRIERCAQAKVLELLESCVDATKLCLPCPLRPVCEELVPNKARAKRGRK